VAKDRRSHPAAPLYYPGSAAALDADQLAGSLNIAFSQVTGLPVTLAGYGIADAYTKAQVDAAFAALAPTNLVGWPANAVGFLKNNGAGVLTWSTSAATVAALDDIGDVVAPTPANGDVIKWDSATSKWINGVVSGAVASVFGRTGAVVAVSGDYAPTQLTGWPANAVGVLANNGAGVLSWSAAGSGTITGSGTAGKHREVQRKRPRSPNSILTESGTVGLVAAGDLTAARFLTRPATTRHCSIPAGEGRALPHAAGPLASRLGPMRWQPVAYQGHHRVPTAVLSGDSLGVLAFKGWDGSAIEQGAQLLSVATENFSGSAAGSNLQFRTSKNGTTSVATRLTIDHDGLVTTPNSRAERCHVGRSGELHQRPPPTSPTMSFAIGANEVWVAEFFTSTSPRRAQAAGLKLKFTVPCWGHRHHAAPRQRHSRAARSSRRARPH
jgi:hypothetical protein